MLFRLRCDCYTSLSHYDVVLEIVPYAVALQYWSGPFIFCIYFACVFRFVCVASLLLPYVWINSNHTVFVCPYLLCFSYWVLIIFLLICTIYDVYG